MTTDWWATLLSIATATSVLTTVLNQLATTWRERSRRRATSSYLSLRIASMLEAFAQDCSGYISDRLNYQSSNGVLGQLISEMPKISDYPSDEEGWRSLDATLADRAIRFPVLIKQSNESLGFSLSVDDDGYDEEMLEELAIRGDDALDLARAIRRKAYLPQFASEYGFEKRLSKRAESARSKRAALKELRAD